MTEWMEPQSILMTDCNRAYRKIGKTFAAHHTVNHGARQYSRPSRLISADANTVAFQWKDYRVKNGDRRSVMRLSTSEFIRRFLIHVLPDRFHRIRHYGLLASSTRKASITKVRTLLGAQAPQKDDPPATEVTPLTLREPCPDCGEQMRIIETFRRGQKPQTRAPPRKAAA